MDTKVELRQKIAQLRALANLAGHMETLHKIAADLDTVNCGCLVLEGTDDTMSLHHLANAIEYAIRTVKVPDIHSGLSTNGKQNAWTKLTPICEAGE